jgi:hypothetical protein
VGSFYAQLTRNGHSDDDEPDVWITPGSAWPAVHHTDVLAELIAEATATPGASAYRLRRRQLR